jgi:hypothetical protein
MAAFATMDAAEVRAVAKVADKTWVNAHSQRGVTGTIGVRVQRFMSPTNPGYGAWVEITDDATV